MTDEAIMKMRKHEKLSRKVEKCKIVTGLVRFFGSLILAFDHMLKIYYLLTSRFTNR